MQAVTPGFWTNRSGSNQTNGEVTAPPNRKNFRKSGADRRTSIYQPAQNIAGGAKFASYCAPVVACSEGATIHVGKVKDFFNDKADCR
jgi:hypothetical protein